MKTLLTICLLASALVLTGCRPDACAPALTLIERVSTALDEERLDAAANGLNEIETLLTDESGYLGGFRERSRGLREIIELQHELQRLEPRERDAAERRLLPLMEGWEREATAVKRRCGNYFI